MLAKGGTSASEERTGAGFRRPDMVAKHREELTPGPISVRHQVRPHRLVEIEHFFQTYKALEDKTVEMVGWRDRERALEVLRTDREAWLKEGHPTTSR